MRQRFLRILLVCSIVSGLVATNMPLAVDAADPGSVLHLGQLGTTLQPGRVNFRLAAVRAKVACASLKGRVLDSLSTITGAADVPAGNGAPAHCEIVVSAKNTLHIAIDLPSAWNKRNYVIGNGGFGGGSVVAASAIAQRDAVLASNFAVASNDDGEPSASFSDPDYGSFLATNPEGLLDYSYRAVHLSALYVKQLSTLIYGQAAAETYFVGCSDGGREGLIEAQRFPDDFNGIVAGAPVLADSDLQIQNAWNVRAYGQAPFTVSQLNTIAASVLDKCGERLNGKADGIVADPRLCQLVATRDIPQCNGTPTALCLTAAQTTAYQQMITGPIIEGKIYFPGMPVGSEANWVGAIVPGTPGEISTQQLLGDNWIRFALGYQTGKTFDPATFNYDTDPYFDSNLTPIHTISDATNTDLTAFERNGGKMISYVGWADPLVGPWSLVGYYESVESRLGAASTLGFYRMFTLPGVAHCAGGTGPDTINPFSALVDWVENGFRPNTLIARKLDTQGNVLFQRLLCMYPYIGQFIDGSNSRLASSWTCIKGPTGVPLTDYPNRNPFDSRFHASSP